MLKTVAAGAAALMIAAGTVAHAQEPPPASPPDGERGHFAEDRAAFLNARMAALRAGLQLTPEQEKTWPAFEKACRELAELRGQLRFGPRTGESLDPVQRAQRRAESLTARGAALKRYAEALGPLYQTFDDGQKRRFAFLIHFGRRSHFHQFGFWRDGGWRVGERDFGGQNR